LTPKVEYEEAFEVEEKPKFCNDFVVAQGTSLPALVHYMGFSAKSTPNGV